MEFPLVITKRIKVLDIRHADSNRYLLTMESKHNWFWNLFKNPDILTFIGSGENWEVCKNNENLTELDKDSNKNLIDILCWAITKYEYDYLKEYIEYEENNYRSQKKK